MMMIRRTLSLLTLGAVWLLATPLDAAPNPPPPGAFTPPTVPPLRSRPSTNAAPPGVRPGVGPSAVPGVRPGTNAAALKGGLKAGSTNAPAAGGSFVDTLRSLPSQPAFYPVVAGVGVCLGGLFLWWAFRSKPKSETIAVAAAAKAAGKSKAVHSCNVLQTGTEPRQVWQFDARGGTFVLGREQTCPESEMLPSRIVGKDWRTLVQPKLNVAWLPPESVFLRVAQFPKSDLGETVAMVELQLEKLSPMPVTQIVWSLHILPHADGNLQTVVVMIAARSAVEELLGKLEGQGFLTDRLELPILDQLQAATVQEDGAWVYPQASGGKDSALVAWWYGGVLQSLDLLTMPVANPAAALKEQLMQMAWAGELDGWLTKPPTWHLVAEAGATEWEEALRAGLEQPVELVSPVPAAKLAALTARRAAQGEGYAGLLPPEYATRYRQQLVDRLWMRGLFGVFALYSVGVGVYLMVLAVASYRTGEVETRVTEMGRDYTNAISLRDKLQVLKDRDELKFAALDCWNTTARLLPDIASLDSLNFSGGKTLSLQGTAPADQIARMLEFEKEMRRATTTNGAPLFDASAGRSLESRSQGGTASWTLVLELKRTEPQ